MEGLRLGDGGLISAVRQRRLLANYIGEIGLLLTTMQPIRPVAISIAFLLFAVSGIMTYFAMDRSDYSFCDKRLVIAVVTLIALGLLIVSLRLRCDKRASIQRRCIKGASYILVIAVSAGFWFDVWATQQCSESSKTRVEKLEH